MSVTLAVRAALAGIILAASLSLAAQTITSVTPSAGPVTGGTEVTIRGTGFLIQYDCPILCYGESLVFRRDATEVDVVQYTVVDDTTIIAVTPPFTPGPVDVIFRPFGFGPEYVLLNGYAYLGAEGIPTASETGLIALGLALASIAVFALRRM